MKEIQIKCKAKDTLAINLLDPLQGDLKILSNENYEKLKNEILEDGFSFAVHIYEDNEQAKIYIIDGHQRVATLTRMKEEGYKIPAIPVVYVEADNLDHAKRKVLAAASQYGQFNQNGANEFIGSIHGMNLDTMMNNFVLPNIDYSQITFDNQNVEGEKKQVSFEVTEAEKKFKEIKDKNEFLILITCRDEKHQAELYQQFQDEDLECRLI